MRILLDGFVIAALLLIAPYASAAEPLSPATIEQKILYLNTLESRPSDLYSLHEQGQLGTFYHYLTNETRWLALLEDKLGKSTSMIHARQRINRCQAEVIQFYRHYIAKAFIGDKKAQQQPSAIVVLGAREQVLAQRLALAWELSQRFPTIPLILSGKGKGKLSEAQQMETFFLSKGISSARLIKEDESMDTIGNAIFTRLLLMQQGHPLPPRILIVTSAFHGPRALLFFRQVFGRHVSVAVALKQDITEPSTLDERIDKELISQALTMHTILSLTLGPNAQGRMRKIPLTGDICSQVYQLLLHDPHYPNHEEILSRLQGLCKRPHDHIPY